MSCEFDYKPVVGDVIEYNGAIFVVVDRVSYENIGSVFYDRKYKLCPWLYFEEVMKNQPTDILTNRKDSKLISEKDFKNLGFWVDVRGIEHPKMKRCEDIPPYEVSPISYLSVRKKSPKTIITYE